MQSKWYKFPFGMNHRSPANPDRVAAFESACRDRGLAVTVQRRRIFEAVLTHAGHPTADEVFEAVTHQIPGVSRTTVYRVLDTLVSIGVISRLTHAGAVTRYEPNQHRHHHLSCSDCGRTVDWEDDSLNQIKLPDTRPVGFEIADFSVHFFGVCQDCRSRTCETQTDTKSNIASEQD